MKQKVLICCLAALALQICLPFASSAKEAAPQPAIEATIHLDQEGAPIHPFVHGMFTELLGNMFENGIWAEMLSDRKFFYPVDNSETLTPRNSRRHQLRWRPVGPESSVTMDKDNPYVEKAFYGLRAASIAMISAAGINVARIALVDLPAFQETGSILRLFVWKAILLALILYFAMKKVKLHPIAFIAISALVGILFHFGGV